MGESIRTIIDNRGNRADGRGIRRGDAYVAQRALSRRHPPARHHRDHAGVRTTAATRPTAFVAARGHHADIGGIAPGSMPPDSRTIDEEGVLLDDVLLVDEGRFREAEMRALLGAGA